MTRIIGAGAGSIIEQLRNAWFIIAAFAGIIYWAAKHDAALADAANHAVKIETLEKKMVHIDVNISAMREDLGLIKAAILK